jgi:DUF1680 family protein
VAVDGVPQVADVDGNGYLCLTREWATGAGIELTFEMEPRVVSDSSGNGGHVAFVRGPLVFAADVALLPEGRLLDDLSVEVAPGVEAVRSARAGDGPSNRLEVRTARLTAGTGSAFGDGGRYRIVSGAKAEEAEPVQLLPFYEAGNSAPDSYRAGVWSNREIYRRATYQVWVPVVTT